MTCSLGLVLPFFLPLLPLLHFNTSSLCPTYQKKMHEVVKTGCIIFTSSELPEASLGFAEGIMGINSTRATYSPHSPNAWPSTHSSLSSMCSCGGEERDRHQLALLLPVGEDITSPEKCYYMVWLLSPSFPGKEIHFHIVDKEMKIALKFTV